MRSKYKLLAIIIALLVLAAIQAKAQDPNSPDTVYVDSVFTNTTSAVVPVYFRNDQPLLGMEVTLSPGYNPSVLVLDSLSFVGSRVENLTNRFLTNHPLDTAFTISAFATSEPLIPIGNGLLCNMHFSFSGALDSTLITFDSTTVVDFDVEWSVTFSDSNAVAFHPQYRPGFLYINGSICCIGNRGNVDSDPNDFSNILDLNFLINRIFRFGAEPLCFEEADVNGDGFSANILDLNFLINRIFRFGAAPGPCP